MGHLWWRRSVTPQDRRALGSGLPSLPSTRECLSPLSVSGKVIVQRSKFNMSCLYFLCVIEDIMSISIISHTHDIIMLISSPVLCL